MMLLGPLYDEKELVPSTPTMAVALASFQPGLPSPPKPPKAQFRVRRIWNGTAFIYVVERRRFWFFWVVMMAPGHFETKAMYFQLEEAKKAIADQKEAEAPEPPEPKPPLPDKVIVYEEA